MPSSHPRHGIGSQFDEHSTNSSRLVSQVFVDSASDCSHLCLVTWQPCNFSQKRKNYSSNRNTVLSEECRPVLLLALTRTAAQIREQICL